MLGTQGKGGALLAVHQDFFHFLEACGGNHEAHGPAGASLGVVAAAGQAEAVHGHGGDSLLGDLKLDAGVDGPGLVLGHGEDGAGDQLLQLALGNPDGPAGVHVRQLRVIIGALGGDGEGGVACPDGHLVILVHHHGDGTLGESSDDVTEELGREDALAGVGHLGLHVVGDGGFHVIAGEAQTVSRPAEDTLDDGKAALGGHGAARNVQTLNQHIFFTGKTHTQFPFLYQ